ncbi:MAG TPA: class I SAM-dependent methyltransferase [Chlamydiales bacterium]|nr:class I SAM-dependent methyltransferase [Chlamydiales bacterium]
MSQQQKEHLAQVYAQHHEQGSRYGYLFCHGKRGSYLKDWIGSGKKILDLGCRDGMLTKFFANGNQVIGVDIDRKALEQIKKRLGIETHWLDLNAEWPFDPESFDVIVACEILEHIFFLNPLLTKIEKSLKQGGIFIGSVPNSFRIRNRWKFLWGEEFDKDATHVRLFSFAKLERTLLAHFQKIEIVPIQGNIAPFLPVHSLVPKNISRLFAKDLLWKAAKKLC